MRRNVSSVNLSTWDEVLPSQVSTHTLCHRSHRQAQASAFSCGLSCGVDIPVPSPNPELLFGFPGLPLGPLPWFCLMITGLLCEDLLLSPILCLPSSCLWGRAWSLPRLRCGHPQLPTSLLWGAGGLCCSLTCITQRWSVSALPVSHRNTHVDTQ